MIKAGQDTVVSDFVIVTTAGEALTALDACYISSADGKAYKCDADDTTKIGFVGFAQETAALNAAVNIVTSGVATGFTGLTPGNYYLSGTPGAISTTQGANKVKVGEAVSTTVIRFDPDDKIGAQMIIPYPVGSTFGTTTMSVVTNTTAQVGLFSIPVGILLNKLSLSISSVTVSGTIDVSIFSDDGQTRLVTFTTGTISAAGVVTTTLASKVYLPAGCYYLVLNPNSTANIVPNAWQTTGIWDTATGIGVVTSEPLTSGTVTITADTPPTTITPASITAANSRLAVLRLDA